MSKYRFVNRTGRSVLALAFLLLAASHAAAQVTTGNLQGVVLDPNKAAVAGAAVTLTNTETGISKTTTTNEDGLYRFTFLQPGDRYKLEITAAGFAPAAVENVAVRLGAENNADVALGLSQVSGGEVVVTDEAQLIDAAQSQLSTNYNAKQITQLPFNGSIDQLALLTPGVAPPESDTDFTNGQGISANGNRPRSNNFQIDGQNNNDISVGGPAQTLTNQEAVAEYQVITNNFSAEFGRNTGAQINVITKSGTNEFHGSLFEFHQNAPLNARDNIEKRSQQNFAFLANNGLSQFAGLANRYERPAPFSNNRFGGSLGGPIKKNKAFFFFTYQADIFRGETQANTIGTTTLTPTAEAVALAAARFPGAPTAQLA
ncbi:MAG TPA: TonB-dependent receptor, partial [Pyrinomonadaceae bacterium]